VKGLIICTILAVALVVPVLAAQHELSWDDGVHSGYYWGPSYYNATTFTAPYDLEIVAFKIYWYNCSATNYVDLDVYDDNGGKPGTGFFDSPVTSTIPVGG
jgi:hypothetical protein